MGSSGSGKFGTYHVDNSNDTNAGAMDGEGASSRSGGANGEVECPKSIENIRLQDVATSENYSNHENVPQKGEEVFLNHHIINGRLVVIFANTGEIVGNLPTQYNFLINCIKSGYEYSGTVVASGLTPIPFIVVSLYA